MSDPNPLSSTDLARLTTLVTRLRAADGCPWDREQTLPDLRAYLLEEAHEVAAALDSGDRSELLGELGDLLFQIVFIARLVEESGEFSLGACMYFSALLASVARPRSIRTAATTVADRPCPAAQWT